MKQNIFSPLVARQSNTAALNFVLVAAGALAISLLAQVAIPLPFTPVPLTGQTFGVSLISLLYGRRRAFATLASYLTLGAMGLPVFSLGSFGLSLGPTSGYLFGMLLSSWVVGGLADRGFARSLTWAYLAATIGSVITFASGLAVLSFFVPRTQLLSAGLLPFIPGDILKNLLAAYLVTNVAKRVAPRS